MKILVTTSAGNIGRRIVRELLAPEFSVRVITRDPSRLPVEIQGQVEIIKGSTDSVATLCHALQDVEALFWCVPSESFEETNVRGHYERFARAGALAIREVKTPRVVTISAGGKGLARNAGPTSALHAMEDILNQSGAAIRHVRSTWFMENFIERARSMYRHGQISYPIAGYVSIPMVAATDIADVALRWLVRDNWRGVEGIAVHGPEDLSFGQAAAVMERTLERPVRYEEASPNQYIKTLVGLGATVEYAQGLVQMFSELAQGIARAEPRTFESTTSTTLLDWAASELLPLVEPLRQPSEAAALPCKV